MSYTTVTTSMITEPQVDVDILYPYISDPKDPWYEEYGGYHTGVDIEGDTIYSMCNCVVKYIGEDYVDGELEKVVICKYDEERCIRYAHLSEVEVSIGQPVSRGFIIGTADRWCHFEYLTLKQFDSQWPVRWGDDQVYYAQDSEDYVDGTEQLDGGDFQSSDEIDELLNVQIYYDPETDTYSDEPLEDEEEENAEAWDEIPIDELPDYDTDYADSDTETGMIGIDFDYEPLEDDYTDEDREAENYLE